MPIDVARINEIISLSNISLTQKQAHPIIILHNKYLYISPLMGLKGIYLRAMISCVTTTLISANAVAMAAPFCAYNGIGRQLYGYTSYKRYGRNC